MINVTISYLRLMRDDFMVLPNANLPHQSYIHFIEKPDIGLFRFLYHEVGHPWRWYEQHELSDETIERRLHADDSQFYLLYPQAKMARIERQDIMGFCEFSCCHSISPNVFLYGLCAPYQGKGLGRRFLYQLLAQQFLDDKVDSITIDTCTLDHPSALPIYQSLGFKKFDEMRKQIQDPLFS